MQITARMLKKMIDKEVTKELVQELIELAKGAHSDLPPVLADDGAEEKKK